MQEGTLSYPFSRSTLHISRRVNLICHSYTIARRPSHAVWLPHSNSKTLSPCAVYPLFFPMTTVTEDGTFNLSNGF